MVQMYWRCARVIHPSMVARASSMVSALTGTPSTSGLGCISSSSIRSRGPKDGTDHLPGFTVATARFELPCSTSDQRAGRDRLDPQVAQCAQGRRTAAVPDQIGSDFPPIDGIHRDHQIRREAGEMFGTHDLLPGT